LTHTDAGARVALVGCGAVVEHIHAKVLQYLLTREPIAVVAAVDPDPSRRELISALFRGCEPIATLADLPTDTNFAIVASPVRFHAEQTIELLRRGIHVLCEKPMAMTSRECSQMNAAAAEAGCLLALGHVRRFYPVAVQIRDMIRNRSLGRALSFRMIEGSVYRWSAVSDAYFRRASGGGALRDIGVHLVDLLLWWFGQPEEVDYRDDAMGGVEANVRLRLAFDGGLTGDVYLSRDSTIRQPCFIAFEHGWAAFDPYDTNRLQIGTFAGTMLDSHLHEQVGRREAPRMGVPGATFQQAFILQFLNFMSAAAGKEMPRTSGEEGAQSIQLIERCYSARRLVDMPWMSEKEITQARMLT